MLVTVESLEQFDVLIKGDKAVVVDFWAPWCGPCKVISPIFEKLSEDPAHVDVVFCQVDIDAVQAVASEFQITVIPTFIYFKGGEKQDEIKGANPKALNALVSKAADL